MPPDRVHFSTSEYCGFGLPDAEQPANRLLKSRALRMSFRVVIIVVLRSTTATVRNAACRKIGDWKTRTPGRLFPNHR
jgi:hypothetical protein